ncbi:MAG: hypothetical protein J2P48_09580, partial [Alphaproteobacteria bacterium]|nr:hypothetical protein [Alphaproteobacteria bacterium]
MVPKLVGKLVNASLNGPPLTPICLDLLLDLMLLLRTELGFGGGRFIAKSGAGRRGFGCFVSPLGILPRGLARDFTRLEARRSGCKLGCGLTVCPLARLHRLFE